MNSKKKKTIYDQAMDVRKDGLNEHSDKVREIEKENEENAKNAKTHAPEDIKSDFDLQEIKADLSLFELKDSGSDTLRVYHPAIDIGAELGIISKVEYGKLTNKESFFKSVLENQVLTPEIEQRHILAFEGEFVEPTVAVESVVEHVTANDYPDHVDTKAFDFSVNQDLNLGDPVQISEGNGHVVKLDRVQDVYSSEEEFNATQETYGNMGLSWEGNEIMTVFVDLGDAEVEHFVYEVNKQSVESQDDSLPQAKMTDEYEKSIQMETQKTESDYNQLSTNILNSLYSQLKHDMKFDSVSILTAKYNDDKTTLNVYTSLHDKVGEKFVSLDIPVEGLTFKPLSNSTVASIVSKTADLSFKITEELKGEVDEKLKQIEADEAWKTGDSKDIVESKEVVDKERFVAEKFSDREVSEGSLLDAMDGIGLESKKTPVKKEAASDSGGTGFSLAVDVLNVDKHSTGLPEDTKVGAVIFADGNYWKLVCKDKSNLSKEENSGSIWTFHKVPVESVDKEPEHSIE